MVPARDEKPVGVKSPIKGNASSFGFWWLMFVCIILPASFSALVNDHRQDVQEGKQYPEPHKTKIRPHHGQLCTALLSGSESQVVSRQTDENSPSAYL